MQMDKRSIVELKCFCNPPTAAITVLSGCVILFESYMRKNGLKVIYCKPQGLNQGKKEYNYWEMAKKYLLNDPNKFVNMILCFEKDNVSQKTVEKLTEKVFSSDLSFDKVKKISSAAAVLFEWVKSIYDYCNVKKSTGLLVQEEKSVVDKSEKESLLDQQELIEVEPITFKAKKPKCFEQNIRSNLQLAGDKILFASMITYGGIFSSEFRSKMQR